MILDYGIGNIGSLGTMLDFLGYTHSVIDDSGSVKTCPMLILPGVGSSKTAMRELRARKLIEPLKERYSSGKAIVGICLGAQVLFEYLEESSEAGLGFIPGKVNALTGSPKFNTGWCHLEWKQLCRMGVNTGIYQSDTFFFNHQYRFPFTRGLKTVSVQGNADIPAIYFHKNLCGVQFHPEKSQMQGRTLLRNILRKYYGL